MKKLNDLKANAEVLKKEDLKKVTGGFTTFWMCTNFDGTSNGIRYTSAAFCIADCPKGTCQRYDM